MIVAVPAAAPVTTPEVELTLAVPEALLVHTPPVGDDDNVVVDPTQTVAVPDMAPGVVFTVTIAVTKHPLLNVYVIVAVPFALPVTEPDDDPTVAIVKLLLVHTPPVGEELKVDDAPVHMDNTPLMAPGAVFTVTTLVAKQPPANV